MQELHCGGSGIWDMLWFVFSYCIKRSKCIKIHRMRQRISGCLSKIGIENKELNLCVIAALLWPWTGLNLDVSACGKSDAVTTLCARWQTTAHNGVCLVNAELLQFAVCRNPSKLQIISICDGLTELSKNWSHMISWSHLLYHITCLNLSILITYISSIYPCEALVLGTGKGLRLRRPERVAHRPASRSGYRRGSAARQLAFGWPWRSSMGELLMVSDGKSPCLLGKWLFSVSHFP